MSVADRRRAALERLRQQQPRPRSSGPHSPRGDEPVALTPAQLGMWYLEEATPGTTVNHVWVCARLKGSLDTDRLQRCFEHLIRRHDALRVRLVNGPLPCLQLVDRATVFLPVSELDSDCPADADSAAVSEAEELARVTFELRSGPMLRPHLFRWRDDYHVLLLVAHHLVLDGASLGVLLHELQALYANAGEHGWSLPPAESFLDWMQASSAPASKQRLDYWGSTLKDLPPLELPLDRRRPAIQSLRSEKLHFALPTALSDELRRVSAEHGVTLFMTLLAALGVLLSRCSGQREFGIAVPIANRPPTAASLVGNCINLTVIRLNLAEARTWNDLLAQVKQRVLEASEFAAVALHEVVESSNQRHDPSRAPLAQVMLDMLSFLPRSQEPTELELSPLRMDGGGAQYDLAWFVNPSPRAIEFSVGYQEDLHRPTTIQYWIECWQSLLADIVCAGSTTFVTQLRVLSERQIEEVLLSSRVTAPKADCTLHDLIEARALGCAEVVAIRAEETSWTYAQLREQVHELADALLRQGVRKGDRVGISLTRSPTMIAAVIAVLRTGAAYVPMDPQLPRTRLALMAERAGVRLVLSDEGGPAWQHPTRGLRVDELRSSAPAAASGDLPEVGVDDLAYAIFTSGSTGEPKAVGIAHGAVVTFCRAMAQRPGMDAADVVLALTTLSFDIAVTELLLPLVVGATVVMLTEEQASDPAAIAQHIEREQVSFLQATPSTLRMLVDSGWRGRPGLKVLSGGEVLDPSLAGCLRERASEVWNMYGPTEATVWALAHRVGAEDVSEVPLGTPLTNSSCVLLDAYGELVPMGSVGEICLGGQALAVGYLGDEGQTSRRFFLGDAVLAGQRLYRTGDLGRFEDGRFSFVGRVDTQVKVRGHRVELGEIEAALLDEPCVGQAAVVLDASKDRLVGYWTDGPQGHAEARFLRERLAQKLPGYMIPSVWLHLDAMPMTGNNKVDRRSLPAVPTQPDAEKEFVAPADELERRLSELMAEALGLESVGVTDNFFDRGGHSLLATRLVSTVGMSYGVQLSVRSFLEAPTVRGLASALEGARGSATAPLLVRSDAPDWPLSSTQRQFWLYDASRSDAAYNVVRAWDIMGVVDPKRVRRALERMMERHDALRLTVGARSGKPRQQLNEWPFPDFAVKDVSHLTPAELATAVAEALHAPFQLGLGPLFRVRLLRRSEQSNTLVFAFSHLIVDDWSLQILAREFSALYQGQPLEARADVVRFVDFCAYQERAIRSEKSLEYWRAQLKRMPDVLSLEGVPDPGRATGEGATVVAHLGRVVTERLRDRAVRGGGTLAAACHALVVLLLHRFTSRMDLILGSAIANREHAQTLDIVGVLMNVMPLRYQLRAGDTFGALLDSTFRTQLEAMAHSDVPLDELLSGATDAVRQSDAFAIVVNYHEPIDVAVAGWTVTPRSVDPKRSRHNLVFDMVRDADDGVVVLIEYDPSVVGAVLARQLGEGLRLLAERVLEAWDSAVTGPRFALPFENQWRSQQRRDQRRVTLMSTFTDAPIQMHLAEWIKRLDLDVQSAFAPSQRVFQELMSDGSDTDGLTFVMIRLEDWANLRDAPDRVKEQLKDCLKDFAALLPARAARGPVVVYCFEPVVTQAASARAAEAMRAAYVELLSIIRQTPGAELCDPGVLVKDYAVGRAHDHLQEAAAGIPFTDEFCAVLATSVARHIRAWCQPPRKLVVVDCDNTLWTGVCGEASASELQLDAGRLELQRRLVALHDRGVLLALASKNNPADVEAVFAQRGDMPLSREHFVREKIGWGNKSRALEELAHELNLGLDAFVFIDDSFVECAEVMAAHPQVAVFHLPASSAQVSAFAKRLWVTDALGLTSEDAQRAAAYKAERERSQLRGAYPTREGFLAGLGLELSYQPMGHQLVDRAAQMCARTNQFNLSTLRHSRSDLLHLAESHELRVVHVRDRFGDYGVTGLIIWREEGSEAQVVTFLLSCRVLGRGVEDAVLSELKLELEERGIGVVTFVGSRSEKNTPIIEYLAKRFVNCQFPAEVNAGFAARAEVVSLPPRPEYIAVSKQPLSSLAPTHGVRQVRGPEPAPSGEGGSSEVPDSVLTLEMEELAERGALHPAHHLPLRHCSAGALLAWLRGHRRSVEPSPSDETSRTERIKEIWQRLLGVSHVGLADEFRDLGGSSVKSIQLLSELFDAFGVQLAVEEVLNDCTVEALDRRIGVALGQPGSGGGGVPLAPIRSRYPLSHSQTRMWLADHTRDWDGMMNVSSALLLESVARLDEPRMRTALARLVQRHESLRTRFQSEGSQLYQVFEHELGPELKVVDLTGHPDPNQALDELRGQEALTAFDLERGPAFRLVLVRVSSGSDALLLTIHHAVADGWSVGVFFEDLLKYYLLRETDDARSLAPLRVQYRDYVEYQSRILATDPSHEEYWTRQFSTPPPALGWSNMSHSPTERTSLARRIEAALDREAVRALAQRLSVSEVSVLLAAFKLLIFRYTGTRDIVVGLPSSGRFHPEFQPQIGCYVNTLPIRSYVGPELSLQDVVRSVARTVRQGLEHEVFPLDRIVKAARGSVNSVGRPLFEVGLVMQDVQQAKKLDAIVTRSLAARVSELPELYTPAHVDLMLVFSESNTSRFALDYRPDVFNHSVVQALGADYGAVLEQLAQRPNASPMDLILSASADCAKPGGIIDDISFDFGTQGGSA